MRFLKFLLYTHAASRYFEIFCLAPCAMLPYVQVSDSSANWRWVKALIKSPTTFGYPPRTQTKEIRARGQAVAYFFKLLSAILIRQFTKLIILHLPDVPVRM